MMHKNTLSLLVAWFLFCLNVKAFNITFRVDMNTVTANYTTPQVNGTFNNWCGACFSMTDADGDNIWEGTTNLNAGSYQYKFTYDNWTGQEILTPGSPCTVTAGSFTNRSLTVTGDAVLPIVCWNSCASCADTPPPPSYYNVTFSLDMSEQSGFGIPEVNGSFNNWCGNCFQMTDPNNDSVYTATTTLLEGTYEFKFSYSNWLGQEILVPGSPCTQTTGTFTNRLLHLSSDTVLSPVCWGSCYGCGLEPQIYDVTFRVDMSEQSGYSIPEVNGTFNGWCGNCNPMSDVNNDSIWELTIPLTEGMMEYKFSFDNWSGQETLDSGSFCTVSSDGFTNRYLNLSSDTVLDLVCFGSCNVCGYTPPPVYSVTFLLDMSQQSGFTTPEVNGTFNNWCGNCFAMSDSNGDNIWEATTLLTAGSIEYKFSNDNWAGEEQLVEGSFCTVTNNGYTNRYLNVISDTILPIACWSSCVLCEPLVEPLDTFSVTFQLDMSSQTNFSLPEVNGSFNDFCGNCQTMLDTSANGIWSVTVSIPEGMYYYVYSTDSLSNIENLNEGNDCAVPYSDSNYYRLLTVSSDTILPLVCWSSCSQCPAPPALYDVTFQLDMSQQSNFTYAEINGSFNNFCGNCSPMLDSVGNGIWQATLSLQAGNYFYYYSTDGLNQIEDLNSGDACAIAFGNQFYRLLNVASDTLLPVVCWSSCVTCEPLIEPLDTFSVTFQLDMSGQSGFSLPEVNGSFNNFCGDCQSMIDIAGNGIWSVTVTMPQGNYYYHYSTDSLSNVEGLNDGDICAFQLNASYYRLLTVSGDTVLPVVCWSSCSQCPAPPALYDVTFQLDMSQQSNFTYAEINGSFNNFCGNCSPMIDSVGNGIWQATLSLPADNYFYYYSTDSLNQTEDLNSDDACAIELGNQYLRVLSVTSDTILPLVCWSSCVFCDSISEPIDTFSVTFQLDMSGQSGFSLPEVNGSFNNFCGDCSPMVDSVGNGIWNVTVSIPQGNYYYYYSTDSLSNVEGLNDGDICAFQLDASYYRLLTVSGDTVLPVVCWSSCSQCPAPPALYDVTFQLDMSQQSNFTSAEINGSFNNFCGDCSPMLDSVGNGIWQATLSLQAGNYFYYYSTDSLNQIEDLNSVDACAIALGNQYYRLLSVTSDTLLPLVCWSSCVSCEPLIEPLDTFSVTFQLDMSGQSGFSLPEVNGSFNNFCGNCSPMVDSLGNGIWSLTVSIAQGNYYYYYSTDSLSNTEGLNDGDLCAFQLNSSYYRLLTVSGDTILPVVCWSSCSQCPQPPVTHNVTFRLDMSQQSGFTTPMVSGTLNNWCGNCFPMSDNDGDNIWEATAVITEGSIEYKFSYDNWAGQEQLIAGGSCTVTNNGFTNRYLNVISDSILPIVCWESCVACDSTPPPPVTYSVTFRVDMSQQSGFTTPEVNGTFNNWCGSCFAMSDIDGDSIWEATTEVIAGAYEYKFSYDNWLGSETLSEGSSCTVTNSGFTNRYLVLSSDTILPVVCWSSCTTCDSTPPPPMMRTVTFRLDMSQQSGFTTPEVNGTFNNWCGSCFPMSDSNGDNIWEATTTLAIGSYEYKYSYDNWGGSEQLIDGSTCTVTNSGFTNRILNLDSDTVLNVVCWSSCTTCDSTPPPPVMHTVTFRVDMSQQSGFTTPEVNGTFNNWCGSCFPMSDSNGDNIWEGTTSLAAGDYQYKFSYDNWSGQESLMPGTACTITSGSFTNRTLSLVSDTILSVVCWESCSVCQEPQPVAVEFIVDVSSQTFNQHVSVAGSFNNFCEDCDTLTAQGNGVYSGVVNVLTGVYEYYFVLDYATSESLSDAPCTVLADSIFLRTVTVTEATTLPEVCWNSCDTCDVSNGVSIVHQIESFMYPNPADATVYINIDEEGAVLEMLDITGSVVYSSVLTAGNNAVPTTKLSQGMYVLFVRNGSAVNRHLLEIIH